MNTLAEYRMQADMKHLKSFECIVKMADDVDSDSDDEIEYSGMIQPPLIKQLQTILSEYPDDGQILKEIIQNAEDAGASEMKILYDGRPAVQEPSTKKAPFRKYFKVVN
uniref:Sacsin n=1 Tax=Magallana gigas TaxID=29159 RepID=K1PGJ8_MAGGI